MSRKGLVNGVVLPIALAFIPGFGHIWLRRSLRGLLLFMLFLSSLNYVLWAEILDPEMPPVSLKFALATAASAWAFSIVDGIRIVVWVRSRSGQGRREASLRKLIGHWMRDELGQADETALRLLRIDPIDPEAMVWSAVVHRDLGKAKEARRLLRRARRIDRAGHWRVLVTKLLAGLDA